MTVTHLAARLPAIETVRRWSQSLAVLDAIVSPEWQYRYFSFDAQWAVDEEVASMRNGSGDEYSITFAPAGAYVRGFDHESDMSPYAQSPMAVWPGVVDSVPLEFDGFVTEQLDGRPETYRSFAAGYYEIDLDRDAVAAVYRHEPVSDALVSALNPKLSLSDLASDLHEMGYRAG